MFFRHFQNEKKKTLIFSFSHHIELFDTKINYFSGQNHFQETFSTLEFGNPLPLHRKKNKK
jgi:hypothetical protein